MNLKARLALLYSLSVFVILVISAVSIYILNESFRKTEFNKRLMLEATESFEIFTSQPELTPENIEALNRNANNSLLGQEIFIFNSSMRSIFSSQGSTIPNISSKLLTLSKIKQHYEYDDHRREWLILYQRFNNRPYYIVISALDVFGKRKNDNLKVLLVFTILGGMLLSGLLAFFYVKQSIQPLEELKLKIESITVQNLKQRITLPKNNNEVWQIADKFNAMLERLELAFEQRKNFVHHASHELRTPLANMLLQTESALNKDDLSPDEYKVILHSLKEEQTNMIELTNSLLELSRYETSTTIKDWTRVRIDEVLYHTAELINHVQPTAEVSINFESVPEDENDLLIRGNESLIKSAIQNLIKNAIQYSENNRVKIILSHTMDSVTLKFENSGTQLSEEEQTRLFIPFFRGQNSTFKRGYGLGLAIVERIMNVHRGSIQYEPVGDNMNRFTMVLPNENNIMAPK